MEKYDLLPQQLLYEGTIHSGQLFQPELATDASIARVHDMDYIQAMLSGQVDERAMRRTGFTWSSQLIDRERALVQGTIDACAYAMQDGIAFNIAGGTHHAFRDRGEGFCIWNDNAIAAQHLIDNYKYQQILMVDLDVHQGNGTAAIFEHEPRVFTFSMHGAHNYPFHKEKSDVDIELEDGTDDEKYLSLLTQHLPKIIQKIKPEFIFYQAGVDILQVDKMGKLACTHDGCKRRDTLVMELAKLNNIPIVINMGGGYAPHIKDIIEAHANTFRIATQLY